jgi:hypothetical protein
MQRGLFLDRLFDHNQSVHIESTIDLTSKGSLPSHLPRREKG